MTVKNPPSIPLDPIAIPLTKAGDAILNMVGLGVKTAPSGTPAVRRGPAAARRRAAATPAP